MSIEKLEDELQRLTEEKSEVMRSYDKKIMEIEAQLSKFGIASKFDDDEDEAAVAAIMADRRAEFQKRYGTTPGGTIPASAGLVTVRKS